LTVEMHPHIDLQLWCIRQNKTNTPHQTSIVVHLVQV